VAVIWLLAGCWNIDPGLIDYVALVAHVLLVARLPTSIEVWGLREIASNPVGVMSREAGASSIIFRDFQQIVQVARWSNMVRQQWHFDGPVMQIEKWKNRKSLKNQI